MSNPLVLVRRRLSERFSSAADNKQHVYYHSEGVIADPHTEMDEQLDTAGHCDECKSSKWRASSDRNRWRNIVKGSDLGCVQSHKSCFTSQTIKQVDLIPAAALAIAVSL